MQAFEMPEARISNKTIQQKLYYINGVIKGIVKSRNNVFKRKKHARLLGSAYKARLMSGNEHGVQAAEHAQDAARLTRLNKELAHWMMQKRLWLFQRNKVLNSIKLIESGYPFTQARLLNTFPTLAVEMSIEQWIDPDLDDSIAPSDDFLQKLQTVIGCSDLDSYQGCHDLVSIILLGIVSQNEFDRQVNVFNGPFKIKFQDTLQSKEHKLISKRDFVVSHRPVANNTPLSNCRVIVTTTRMTWSQADISRSIQKVFSVHLARKDKKCDDCCAWGVCSIAHHWAFIKVDDTGHLSVSDSINLTLSQSDRIDLQELGRVYRFLYHIIHTYHAILHKSIRPLVPFVQPSPLILPRCKYQSASLSASSSFSSHSSHATMV
eukprot:jgi/Hompol1/3646/HPOL_000278-RA